MTKQEADDVVDKVVNIEIQEDTNSTAGNVQLPLNFITAGEIENDDVKVYIRQDVYKKIERFANSDTTKELGSILLGDYSEALGKVHVVVSEYIEAKYTDASASTLTFTHETWNYIHGEHDKLYPQLKMLGWQHTHPNYGIFLSNYDMFIQENFFNMPFQVAYVVDPIQNIRGFFQWKNGKVEKLKGFYIYDDVGKPIKIEQMKPKTELVTSTKVSKKPFIILLTLLGIFAVAVSALFVSFNDRLEEQLQHQESLESIISQQDADLQVLRDTLSEDILDSDNSAAIEDLIKRIESQQIVLDNQAEVLTELRVLLEETDDNASTIVFTSYTVQRGDCLEDICTSFGLDYQANIKIIKALNGIEDVNSIYVGQMIILPIPQAQN